MCCLFEKKATCKWIGWHRHKWMTCSWIHNWLTGRSVCDVCLCAAEKLAMHILTQFSIKIIEDFVFDIIEFYGTLHNFRVCGWQLSIKNEYFNWKFVIFRIYSIDFMRKYVNFKCSTTIGIVTVVRSSLDTIMCLYWSIIIINNDLTAERQIYWEFKLFNTSSKCHSFEFWTTCGWRFPKQFIPQLKNDCAWNEVMEKHVITEWW